MQTQAVEDYLKTIYEIQREHGKVATTVLAERLNIAPASATGMIKKLDEMNLVAYEPYQGVRLTESGRKIALEVIRHHRLVELYLAESLGVPWDQVHDEAEKWEHILSDDVEERMDKALGYPTLDPHGAPIPGRDGSMATVAQDRLIDLRTGQVAVIVEVSDHDADMLRLLGDLGLYPSTIVTLISHQIGLVTVQAEGVDLPVPEEIAAYVFVQVMAAPVS